MSLEPDSSASRAASPRGPIPHASRAADTIAPRSLRAFALLVALVAAGGCGFADPSPLVPSYTCGRNSDCSGDASCIENVCAASTAVGYEVVLRISRPSSATIPGLRAFTFAPVLLEGSGQRDLFFPTAHPVYGVVRFGEHAVAAQVGFTRRLAIAGSFIDDVRVVAPTASSGEDGAPADYRVDLARVGSYIGVVKPSSAMTPAWPGVPSALVGRPLSEVFPPQTTTVEPNQALGATSRFDFVYDESLFIDCGATSGNGCTARGRLVSKDVDGGSVIEAGLRVELESVATGQPISTAAVSAADGTFELRVSTITEPYRIHLGPTDERPAYPDLRLAEQVFDAELGGDVEVPSFHVVRYVARVEFGTTPVPGALVRAVARELRTSLGAVVYGATFESVARTTTAASIEGPGLFGLELVEGTFDIVASDSVTPSSVVRAEAQISRTPGGGALLGQVFALGPARALVGTVSGPGPSQPSLPFAQIQALPYVPMSRRLAPEAYARPASATSDEAGNYDLQADPGFYDLIVSVPASEGLANAVMPSVPIGNALAMDWLPLQMPLAAVLFGQVVGADSQPIAGARVEAYAFLPQTEEALDRTIALGSATADASGHYRLLVPSTLLTPP